MFGNTEFFLQILSLEKESDAQNTAEMQPDPEVPFLASFFLFGLGSARWKTL